MTIAEFMGSDELMRHVPHLPIWFVTVGSENEQHTNVVPTVPRIIVCPFQSEPNRYIMSLEKPMSHESHCYRAIPVSFPLRVTTITHRDRNTAPKKKNYQNVTLKKVFVPIATLTIFYEFFGS